MWRKSYDGSPSLYLIPTPIGNLDDITLRAIKLLQEVEVIFCEDTRVTGELLNYLNIKKKLISCNEQNENKIKETILEYLQQNKNIALVTDRGTPIISDPGYKIISYIIKEGYNVIGLPGPTALIPALIVSGIAPHPFLFYGFLNSKEVKKEKELEKLKSMEHTIIFYEAPHRIKNTLLKIKEILGNRKVSISREISKKFEEIFYGTVEESINENINLKGEFVIVVEGNNEKDYNHLTIIEHINLYIKEGYSEKEAIKKVANDRNIAKNIIYKEYHVR